MRKFLPACAAGLLVASLQARAQFVDPSLPWRTFDTAHFSVHFAEPYRVQARTVAEVAESVYPRVTGWLKWKPESRTHILVLDSFDVSNGYASPIPFNFIGIILSPPDSGELLQNREWLELVLTHEFTHTVHMDKASRAPLVMRRIFGRALPYWLVFPNTLPNALSANWVKEGLAVYAESDPSRRWGRLGQSHFEGQMRGEVARGLLPLDEINADGRGFPLNRDYLYGGYFFLFLAERYGSQAVARYVENYSGNFIPYRMHTGTVPITRKTQDVLWRDYEAWLHARFAAKTEQGGRVPDEGGRIIARDWTVASPLRTSSGDRWYVQGDGYTLPRLMHQKPGGGAESVREVDSGTQLAAFPDGQLLLMKPEICDNYNYYYDLYRLTPRGGLDRLTRCGRFRLAAALDGGRIAAVRVVKGEAEVVVLNQRGEVERSLYRAAPGEELSGLAARGDTAVVTSLRDNLWSLVEIAGGKASVLVSDAAVKHSPRFGDSGDEIYFVADYGNVSNVWSWRRTEPALARWSGARNGVLDISAPVAGEMLVTTIEADGGTLRAHGLPDMPLELRRAGLAEAAPPAAPPGGPSQPPPPGAERPYSAWSSLLPRSWFPTFYADQGAFALGVQTFGQDALGLHQYTVMPMWEFSQHTGLGNATYTYNDRHGLLVSRSMTVKASDNNGQDLTGGVQAYAINETAQWVSLLRQLSLGWRYYAGVGAAFDQEIDYDRTTGTSAKAHDERVLGLVAGVDTTREQYLSEGSSQGQELRLYAETSNHLPGFYSGNFYRGDWRAYIPAGKTVVSLRWNQTYSQPEAETVQLGGTGSSFSETSFALPVLNQREFPLRGYRSGEAVLTGHRSSLITLEWRIPISDVDRASMVPPVGTNRVSLALFTEGGKAWDNAPRQWYKSAGAELLWEVRFGYVFGTQLRLGVARGFESPGENQAYLRLGRSF